MPTSFKPTLHPKRRSAVRLITKAGSELQTALIRRKRQGKFTQAELARLLSADRSVVNRHFSGYSNLTLNTIGELAWALDHDVDIKLTPKAATPSKNDQERKVVSGDLRTARTRNSTHIKGSVPMVLQADDA